MKAIKKIILFVFLSISYISSFAQNFNTVSYDIVRNDPANINSTYIYVMPLNMDFSANYINVSYGFGAEYNFGDKLVLGVDFKRSYTEKLNNLLHDFDNLLFIRNGSAVGGEKNYTTYEFSAQYLIGGKLRNAMSFPVVDDGINSTTFIKIKSLQYLAFAFRASYGFHKHNITNVGGFGTKQIKFNYNAYRPDNPIVNITDIAGSTMFNMQYVSLGVGVFQKQDLKFTTEYYGTKDYSIVTTYYFDVLIPVSQELTNMAVTDRTNGAPISYVVNVNKNTPMTKYGYRIGMKYQSVSKLRKINSGGKVELGFLPGPNKLSNNFFISLGLDINISFDTSSK